MPRRTILAVVSLFLLSSTANAQTPEVRLDRHGDPLPPGAIARLGTSRLRIGIGPIGLDFAPDGKTIATARIGSGLRLWDVASGKLLNFKDVPLTSERITTSSDGRWLAFRSNAGIVIWEPRAAKEVAVPFDGDQLFIPCMTFSPSGSYLAIASNEISTDIGSVRIVDAATGRERIAISNIKCHIQQMAYRPDGQTLVVVDAGNTIHHYDPNTGELRKRVLLASNGNATAPILGLSPGGQWMVVKSRENEPPSIWDSTTGERRFSLEWTFGNAERVSFSRDGQTLGILKRRAGFMVVRPNSNLTAQLGTWDPATGKLLREIDVSETVSGFRVSSDGHFAAISFLDRPILSIWDMRTGKPLPTAGGHTSAVSKLALSAAGWVVSCTSDEACSWDIADARPRWTTPGHFFGIAVTPDDRSVLTCTLDGCIEQREQSTGEITRTVANGRQGVMSAFSVTTDGQFATIWRFHGSADSAIEVYAIQPGDRGSLHFSVPPFPSGYFLDANRLRVGIIPLGAEDEPAVLQDLVTGHRQPLLPGFKGVFARAVSPDGRVMIAIQGTRLPQFDPIIGPRYWEFEYGHARVAETLTGSQLLEIRSPISGRNGVFHQLVFAPDGRSLAVSTSNGTLLVFDLATGREQWSLVQSDSQITSLAFTQDGARLLSGHEDGTILVWDVAAATRRESNQTIATEAQLDMWWTDLASNDAARALASVIKLADVPKQSVQFLSEKLKKIEDQAPLIHRLLVNLDSPQFAERAASTRQLIELGEEAEKAMRQALDANPSPEQRQRLQSILGAIVVGQSPQIRRIVRAVWVLERAGTPEAPKVLETLSAGPAASRLTQEARDALARLRRVPR